MSEPTKPQEWYLPLNTLIIIYDKNRPGGVHVVEYSALEAARQKLSLAIQDRDSWKSAHTTLQDAAQKEIEQFKACAERLRQITSGHDGWCRFFDGEACNCHTGAVLKEVL